MDKQTLPEEISDISDIIEILKVLLKSINDDKSDKNNNNNFTNRIRTESFPYGIWFRGEGKYDEKAQLFPRIFRKNKSELLFNEPSLMNHIQNRIVELYQILDPCNKICQAQHYGIPTRLLDWSESILVATYFAVASTDEEDIDGMLYILNAYSLNDVTGMGLGKGRLHTPQDYGTLFRTATSFVFSCEQWKDRIKSQYPEFSFERLSHDDEFFRENYYTNNEDSRILLQYFCTPIAFFPARPIQRMNVQSSVILNKVS